MPSRPEDPAPAAGANRCEDGSVSSILGSYRVNSHLTLQLSKSGPQLHPRLSHHLPLQPRESGPQPHPRLSHRLPRFGRNAPWPCRQSHLPLKPGDSCPRPPAPTSQHRAIQASLPQAAPAKRRGPHGATSASCHPAVPVRDVGLVGSTLVNPPAALLAKKLGESRVLLLRLLAGLMYHQQASLGDIHPLHGFGEWSGSG
jgi:hypothetical protein